MSAVHKLNVVMTHEKPVKVRLKLRAKPRAKLDMHRLPFVGRDHVTNDDGSYCFWDVPFNGGYFGGHETGQAIALMYLAHLRRMNGRHAHPLHTLGLGSILAAMMRRAPLSIEEHDSRRGQLAGFTSVVDKWLNAAVSQLGENLDAADQVRLLKAANAGFDLNGAQARVNKALDEAGLTDKAEHG